MASGSRAWDEAEVEGRETICYPLAILNLMFHGRTTPEPAAGARVDCPAQAGLLSLTAADGGCEEVSGPWSFTSIRLGLEGCVLQSSGKGERPCREVLEDKGFAAGASSDCLSWSLFFLYFFHLHSVLLLAMQIQSGLWTGSINITWEI